MRPKLTCLIPCKNEAANIAACIQSFRSIADEVLIADSGSTDGTLEIVRQLGGCRIVEREYRTSGDFKNWAIPQATHPWVLLLDADERVTPELADEVVRILEDGPQKDGYRIYRNNHFMGHPVKSCGMNNDWVIRLFDRDKSRYKGDTDHARIDLPESRLGRLNALLDHYTVWSYDQWFRKYERYAKVQAQIWYDQGRRPSYFELLTRAPLRFVRDYIFQLGILEGQVGLQMAMLAGYYSYMKQARLWELHYAKKQADVCGAASPEAQKRRAA